MKPAFQVQRRVCTVSWSGRRLTTSGSQHATVGVEQRCNAPCHDNGHQVALCSSCQDITPVVLVVGDAGECSVPGEWHQCHLDDSACSHCHRIAPRHPCMDVQHSVQHGVGREGRVSWHEGEPHLLQLMACGIAAAGEFLHIGVGHFAQDTQVSRLAELEEVRPQAPDGVLGNVGDQLACRRTQQEHSNEQVQYLQWNWYNPSQEQLLACSNCLGNMQLGSHSLQHNHHSNRD